MRSLWRAQVKSAGLSLSAQQLSTLPSSKQVAPITEHQGLASEHKNIDNLCNRIREGRKELCEIKEEVYALDAALHNMLGGISRGKLLLIGLMNRDLIEE